SAGPLQGRGRGPQIPTMLAEARAVAGDFAGAEAASRAALAEDPRDVGVRRQLALVLLRRNQAPAAEAILREGRVTQPADPVLQATLVTVVREARGLDAALALADEIARRPESRPASLSLRGELLAAAQRPAEAAQAFADGYALAPSAGLAVRRATMLAAAGRPDEATAALQAWLTREPEDAVVLSMMSQFDLQAGRLAEAERRLEVVVRQRPADAIALNNLAWLLDARGADGPRALALAERAFLLSPNPASADTLGWILVRRGNTERGVALLRQATEASRGPAGPNPGIAYRLAYGLKAAGQRDEALATLRPVLEGSAQFPERRDAERLMAEMRAGN
uniref:tetratricopeptide repeat protein n=1 Tax=Roseomonas rosulenta TaxID=2748667 RepID=UPI001E5F0455